MRDAVLYANKAILERPGAQQNSETAQPGGGGTGRAEDVEGLEVSGKR